MRPISGLRLLPLLVLSIASCGDHRDLAPFNFTASREEPLLALHSEFRDYGYDMTQVTSGSTRLESAGR